ncbi:hypothetical protein G6F23_015059 [Rhizopus arrhizus]|nr:hypothetical protein G6F23_015059 [Rhizopus arrhizus]
MPSAGGGGEREPGPVRTRPYPGCGERQLAYGSGRHREPRHCPAQAVPGVGGALRHQPRHDDHLVRRQQQLVCGLGRVDLRHLRHRQREDPGRRTQEMGGRRPAPVQ